MADIITLVCTDHDRHAPRVLDRWEYGGPEGWRQVIALSQRQRISVSPTGTVTWRCGHRGCPVSPSLTAGHLIELLDGLRASGVETFDASQARL